MSDEIRDRLASLSQDVLDSLSFDETIVPNATLVGDETQVTPFLASRDLDSLHLPTLRLASTPETPESVPEGVDFSLGPVLGEGGMGRVVLAEQRSLRRDVAVKLLKSREPSHRDALLREAMTMGWLEHPNIVPVYDLGISPEAGPLFVMRKVTGVSWRSLVQDPEHPFWKEQERTADRLGFHIDVMMKLCDALDYAHACGVIHRDIKPDNVMLGSFGEVYLVDWGVALDTRRDPSPEHLVGTPAYMAPEMLAGDPEAMGPTTDVYLLGATLYEVLTGRPPHSGDSLYEAMLSVNESEPVHLPEDVPQELAEIVQRAMSRASADRFQDAGSMRAALARFLTHRSSLEISEAAHEKLEQLESLSPGEAVEAQRVLFAECRFGFLLALREWEDNSSAREGLERSLERMLAVELEHRDATASRRLYNQLEAPAHELLSRLEALEAELVRDQEEYAQLQAMRRQLDLRQDTRSRARFFLFTCAAGVVCSVGIWLFGRSVGTITHVQSLYFIGLVSLVFVLFTWLWRETVFSSLINRRLVYSVGVAMGALFLHRGAHTLLESDIVVMLTLDPLIVGSVIMVSAVTIHPYMAAPGLAFLMGTALMLLWPQWYLEWLNTCIIVASCAWAMVFQILNGEAHKPT